MAHPCNSSLCLELNCLLFCFQQQKLYVDVPRANSIVILARFIICIVDTMTSSYFQFAAPFGEVICMDVTCTLWILWRCYAVNFISGFSVDLYSVVQLIAPFVIQDLIELILIVQFQEHVNTLYWHKFIVLGSYAGICCFLKKPLGTLKTIWMIGWMNNQKTTWMMTILCLIAQVIFSMNVCML